MNDSHDLTVSQGTSETQPAFADGHPLPTDHSRSGIQSCSVGGHHLAVSHWQYEIQHLSADGHPLPTDQRMPEIHGSDVGGHHLAVSQRGHENHEPTADGHSLPTDHRRRETHIRSVGGHPPAVPPNQPPSGSAQAQKVPGDGWAELRICANLLDRLQRQRIAIGNMLGSSDRDMFGPELEQLKQVEHAARLMLRRCYRRVVPASLRQLQKNEPGLGEDSFARILGHLGDPYIAIPHWHEGTGDKRIEMVGEPYTRTIGQLWQYCGHGAPGRLSKGMTAEQLAAMGNPTVKMLVHLQAEFCMKQKGRYRTVYETVRAHVADKTHTVPCIRCGPSGKPAQEGTPWSIGHQHAHALRVLGKEILRDMWLVRHSEVTGNA